MSRSVLPQNVGISAAWSSYWFHTQRDEVTSGACAMGKSIGNMCKYAHTKIENELESTYDQKLASTKIKKKIKQKVGAISYSVVILRRLGRVPIIPQIRSTIIDPTIPKWFVRVIDSKITKWVKRIIDLRIPKWVVRIIDPMIPKTSRGNHRTRDAEANNWNGEYCLQRTLNLTCDNARLWLLSWFDNDVIVTVPTSASSSSSLIPLKIPLMAS